MRIPLIVIGIMFAIGSGLSSNAGEVSLNTDGSTTWIAGVDGVEIEWGSDGTVRRIYSRQSVPVEFADRRGIAKAQVVAEEKAKAGIIRFMNQSVATTRIVLEVQSDINKATQHRKTGTTATTTRVGERTLVEALTEVTASFASGTLQGVIVLERGYDDKTEEAWVVVGISDKTINASRGIKKMIEGNTKANETSVSPKSPETEIRRSNQKDW